MPRNNVIDAEKEIEQAHNDGTKCNTVIVGVSALSEAENAIFQSVISVEDDETVIKLY